MTTELPLPAHYRPENAERWAHAPDATALFEAAGAWRRRHGIAPAGEGGPRITLLVIDAQRDFCFPEGALFVGGRSGRGALDDGDRLARFVYRNLHRISTIVCTLDTHRPFQIFFPEFWQAADGAPLAPHREIRAEDLRAGTVRPRPEMARLHAGGDTEWLERQVLDYCERLEASGRYRLYLWPPHCLAGGDGHALAGIVQEARLFHAYCREARAPLVRKGEAPLTEFYSAIAPEVATAHDGSALAPEQRALLDELLGADALVVAGQASSHCVRATLDDLVDEAVRRDPRGAERIWILEDAMSAVTVADPGRPGEWLADFTGEAEAALTRFVAAGARRLRSLDPLPEP